MTEYLKKYMEETNKRLRNYADKAELEEIFLEHKDKIAFMQHERLVHFLVTMLFAIVLSIFICTFLFTENPALMLLVVIESIIHTSECSDNLILDVYFAVHISIFLFNELHKLLVVQC